MATGDTVSSRRSYVRNVRQVACGEYINIDEHMTKISHQDSVLINFTNDEANKLLYPHNDALVGEIKISDNIIRRVLIDNGSFANILFMDASPAGLICLLITIDDEPEKATQMVEFLVVDKPSERARKCYVGAVNKVCHKVPQLAVVTTIFKIDEIETPNSKINPLSDLDPRVSEEEIRAQPVEDLVPFHLDHEYPNRSYAAKLDTIAGTLGLGFSPKLKRAWSGLGLAAWLRTRAWDHAGLRCVTRAFQVKEERMAKYLGKVKSLLDQFKSHIMTRISRSENNEADVVARLASGIDADSLVFVPVERLNRPSIKCVEQVLCSENVRTWMDSIINYLTTSQLPENQEDARRIKNTLTRKLKKSAPADHTVLEIQVPLGKKMMFLQWEADQCLT
ncbi:hypothetical protein TIFTF001_040286 [Ficus carica]|uniref:Uncharacterized protein n=1 Tax=Ficus carica TaxID=3494 RepID=A0AA87YUT4_FICCA|nr:hypothetical protein TIFTF001_040286 [Ficus carica]